MGLRLNWGIAIAVALALTANVTLLATGRRVLIGETLVHPGETYVVAEYGDLGKAQQAQLACRYWTGRGIREVVFWYAPSGVFGRDECPFLYAG